MSSIATELVELNEMIRCMPAERRTRALKHISNLLVQIAEHCRAEHLDVFDDVLSELIVDADSGTLSALSRLLADTTNAPTKLIERLALDNDITVAEPVLMKSCCISDEALCRIARAKSESHRLAIACRPRLSPAVTDLLLDDGEAVVVRYVTFNQGAQFSDAGIRALAKASGTDGELATLISQRKDLAGRIGPRGRSIAR